MPLTINYFHMSKLLIVYFYVCIE